MEDNISIFPAYDSSFYIINQSSETGNINICQVNIKGDNLWKEIQNLAKFTYVQLKLSDTTFICAGRFDSSQNIFISKLDFTESSAQWTNMLSWASSLDWTSNYSEWLADNNKSNAYWFLAIGWSGNYLFYSNFNTTNGLVVGTRYKSTANISMIYGSAMSGE